MRRWRAWVVSAGVAGGLMGCREHAEVTAAAAERSPFAAKVSAYTPVRLTADLSGLTDRERRMLPLLLEAAAAMDTVYQQQYYPPLDSLKATLRDSAARRLVEINAGPWDRLDENRPFVAGVGERLKGADLYPHDMTKEEFDQATAASPAAATALRSTYTVVRRDSAGGLVAVP